MSWHALCLPGRSEKSSLIGQKILVKNLRFLGEKSLIQREVPLWGWLTFRIEYGETPQLEYNK